MYLLKIALGFIVLILGRKIFWLTVAIVGFLVGMEFTDMLLADQPTWVLLAGGLAAGLIGALLAVLAQRVAFGLAGFFAAGYLTLIVAQSQGVGGTNMIIPLVGGVIGALVAVLLMDWAIIVLSCLVGAGVIVTQLQLSPLVSAIFFAVLVIIGIVIQAKLMERSQEPS
jgi:hypothetical protein